MNVIRRIFSVVFPGAGLNKSLRILIMLNMAITFVIGIFAPFYAVFVAKIGGDIAFAGFSWAILGIISGILTLFFTKWELRIKEQELLLALGYFIRGVVFLSYAFMASMSQLILTQILWGVAVAISVPAFDAIYSAHTTRDGSIAEWGGLEGVSSIATGVAALIGGIVVQTFGFQPIFFVMSGVAFFLALYIWFLPREVL
jgi:predicted MFS family arabinose efflux permease